MLGVVPDEGKVLWLYWALVTDGSDLEDFIVDLFASNTVVDDASTAADFTLATFTGYLQVPIARGDFSSPVIVSDVAETNNPTAPQFNCTGGAPETCYGWIMRGDTSGKIVFGQNFDVPRVMSAGASELLSPFTLKFKSFV